MPLIPMFITPISRAKWELVVYAWQFFPVFTAVQWLTDWYPQGKTSVNSRFNIPGKLAWILMECPGVLTVLYLTSTLPTHLSLPEPLPIGNYTMTAIYTIHYLYRALLSPLLNPSMSPIHPLVFASAFAWQLINGISLGGWLGGYGPTTPSDWHARSSWIYLGLLIWGAGLSGNMYHDDELREIRRVAAKEVEQKKKQGVKDVKKHYEVPEGGLFRWVLYPHYLCEWIEWAGFWMIGGLACAPARVFLVNEVATMMPRALAGRRWYVERFGKEKIGGRRAVLPGLL